MNNIIDTLNPLPEQPRSQLNLFDQPRGQVCHHGRNRFLRGQRRRQKSISTQLIENFVWSYIELFKSPIDLLRSESDSIMVVIVSDSSFVEASNRVLRELVRD
jgi:hypothetical protein